MTLSQARKAFLWLTLPLVAFLYFWAASHRPPCDCGNICRAQFKCGLPECIRKVW